MGKRRFLFREPVLIALGTLRAHKLRSFLTLLGIIISVFTLIGVMSVIEGLNRYIAERVADFGTNVFYVTRYPIITNFEEFAKARRRNPKMTLADYEYLRARMTLARAVGAQDWREDLEVRGGNESIQGVVLRGVTPNLIDISTEKVAAGRYLIDADYQRRALVAFIGADVVEGLFPHVDPLGKTVTIDGWPFEVVGVAEKMGSVLGQSVDNFVIIPLTTLHKYFGQGAPYEQGVAIAVQTASPAVMAQAQDEARTLMRIRRGQKFEEKDRFGIIARESLTNLWDQIFGGLAAAAVGVVSVFLVVGGIVIMNIMLASVTERTREVGIRKSLGARRRDILLQFLVEASVLSTTGGLIGVVLAMGATLLVTSTTPVPMRTPLTAVLLAVGIAAAIGLFFGVYPAQKAARLDPVVALRSE